MLVSKFSITLLSIYLFCVKTPNINYLHVTRLYYKIGSVLIFTWSTLSTSEQQFFDPLFSVLIIYLCDKCLSNMIATDIQNCEVVFVADPSKHLFIQNFSC